MSRWNRLGCVALTLGALGCTSETSKSNLSEAGTGGSATGGASSTGGSLSTGGSTAPEDGGVVGPAIVAVGYAGLRVVSYDLGKTWEAKQTLGTAAVDDPTNLRAVGFGNGLFVAAGHRIFTSVDGATWIERSNPQAQWIGGIAYGNDRWVGAGGWGYSVWSTDGITWTVGGERLNEPARSLAFGNGTFMAHTDQGNWWSTTDGVAWVVDSGSHTAEVGFCNGAFQDVAACGPASGFGVFVRPKGWDSGVIERSTDGTTWEEVTVGFVGDVNAFAFGTVSH